MSNLISFIGFGEAASSIAAGLKEEGLTGMRAYDVMQNTQPQCDLIRQRAEKTGVELVSTLAEAVRGAKFVLSLNSAAVCVSVAKEIVSLLKPGQVLVDCNSSAPTSMSAIAGMDFAEGALFCDAAMMGGVPQGRHQTKMFLSGNGAQAFFDAMQPYHTKMTVLSAPAGGASAIKMFKSVWSKGVPQLVIESLIPALQYGVFSEALSGIKNPFEGEVEDECRILVSRTMRHAKRRSSEMHDVSKTIEEMGLDASMSRATEAKLARIAAVNYPQEIDEEPLVELIRRLLEI